MPLSICIHGAAIEAVQLEADRRGHEECDMYAMVLSARGAPLTFEQRPDPVPGPGEVLVETYAAPVNYVDILVVGGTYQFLPSRPWSFQSDAASEAEPGFAGRALIHFPLVAFSLVARPWAK